MNNILHFQEWSRCFESNWKWCLCEKLECVFVLRLLVSHRESFYLLDELSMGLYSLLSIALFVLPMTNAWLRWNQNSLVIALMPCLSVSVCLSIRCTWLKICGPSGMGGCNQYLSLRVCPLCFADITTTRGFSTRPKGKDSPISSTSTN